MQQGSQYRPCVYSGAWPSTLDEYWDQIKMVVIPWYLKCYHFASHLAHGTDSEGGGLGILLHHGRHLGLRVGPGFEDFRIAFEEALEEACSVNEHKIDPHQAYSDLNAFLAFNHDGYYIDSTRVLASTTEGRLGWIPEKSQPGDMVCLIKGAPFPFIVRARDDGFYTIIGDAHIEGIMHGEAWPDNEDEVDLIGFK